MTHHYVVDLAAPDDFPAWLEAACRLAGAEVPPEAIDWPEIDRSLFAEPNRPLPEPAPVAPPAAFVEIAEDALCHAAADRFDALYRLLRLALAEPGRLDDPADPRVAKVAALAAAVRRDCHEMTAFVRFRRREREGEAPIHLAWYEPQHHVLRLAAPHFVRRFGTRPFAILTPRGSVAWDGASLRHGPGASRRDVPDEDPVEALWLTYYASIFNPVRLNLAAMKSEMPMKYWRNLPEAALVPDLVRTARARAATIAARATAPRTPPASRPQGETPSPTVPSLDDVAAHVRACRACPLHAATTRAVPGEGPRDATLMIVGEQPGDAEDLAGRPFRGPAGRLLDEALARCGLRREEVWITDAVKHFRYEPRGLRRLYRRPDADHLAACAPWLERELELVRPKAVLALGTTALRALTGRRDPPPDPQGPPLRHAFGGFVVAARHPAALLDLRDPREKRLAWREFRDAVRLAVRLAGSAEITPAP